MALREAEMNLTIKILELEEGWRERPYYCSEGYPTVGYGFKIGGKGDPLPRFSLPRKAGDAWLAELLDEVSAEVSEHMKTVTRAERRAIILSMCYQLGIKGCFAFTKMWAAIAEKDWQEAAKQMLDSKWARQTPERALRHAQVMESGSFEGVYT